MKIVSETSLDNFEAWSGGYTTLCTLRNKLSGSDLEDLELRIEEMLDCNNEGITDTELNDFLWFETDTIANLLGYRSWEAFEKGSDEDEEEEEEDDGGNYKDLDGEDISH